MFFRGYFSSLFGYSSSGFSNTDSAAPAPSAKEQLPAALRERLCIEGRKLKVEILECTGGSGHKMSAEAVKQAVEGHFGLENVEITKYDVGSHLAPDPLSVITFGRYSVINLHNFLARNGHTKLISVLSKVGRVASKIQSPFTLQHFEQRYKKQSPDLVISAIPLINGVVLRSLKGQNIPLMVVSTDGDNHLFSENWHPARDIGPYRYGIPYNSLEIARKVSKNVDLANVRGIGYPLRGGYTKSYTAEQKKCFREKHLLSNVDHFVGFMMGGLGGSALQKYFKTVMKGVDRGELERPNTRFAFFCANNKSMRKELAANLEKRGWRCDLRGGKGAVVKNCNHQIRTLQKIGKKLTVLKDAVETEKTFSHTIEKLQSLRNELKENKTLYVGNLDSSLRSVMERGWAETDRLVSAFSAVDEQDQSDENYLSAWLKSAQETVFAVQQTYGNIIDDVKVYRHTSGASTTIQGFTSEDHEYVAVSDVWVTKTGSSTFNQCLYQHLPMLLDGTARALDWEQLNFELGETYGFSKTVSSYKSFFPKLNKMLDPEVNKKYRIAEKKYLDQRTKQTQFSSNIVDLTYELLHEAEERKVEQKEKAGEASRLKAEKASAWKKLSVIEKAGTIFKAIYHAVSDVLTRVIKVAFSILFAPLIWLGKNIVNYAYFSGFSCSESRQKARRRELIRDKNAQAIEGESKPLSSSLSNRTIDALRIPSTSPTPTGNAIIYVLGKHYQDYHPQNYDHLLADGADVILFNPSEKDSKTMAADLKELIKELRRRNPDQKLAMHGYCIGGHVASAVAADIAAGKVEEMKAESIPAIIDRGFEDAHEVASFANRMVNLPFARKYINRYYNANSISIEEHKAPMLFVTPIDGKDQVNHRDKRNFTLEIMQRHKKGMNQVIQLVDGDHWSAWTIEVHNKAKKFLSKQGIIGTTYRKVHEDDFGGKEKLTYKTSVPWVRRNVVPVFV